MNQSAITIHQFCAVREHAGIHYITLEDLADVLDMKPSRAVWLFHTVYLLNQKQLPEGCTHQFTPRAHLPEEAGLGFTVAGMLILLNKVRDKAAHALHDKIVKAIFKQAA